MLALFFNEYYKIYPQKLDSWTVIQPADCALVLTGGPNRVREGFDLLENKKIKKLIVSGVYSNARLREIMPLWPFYKNLDEKDVILERRSETTYGNAQQSLPIIEALNCRDILLVTSSTHMYRALKTFQAHFPSNIQIYPHPVVGVNYYPKFYETALEAIKSFFYSFWAY